jgi:tetratricopeptide (TPR) repeat protein
MKKDRAKPAAPEAPPYDYDVFISYSSEDKAWVRGELLKQIENAGLRAFIDFRDFTRGAVSIREMERGVIECRKTLLILTPEYIESEWAEIEVRMGQTLSPANRDLRLIPLLKRHCDKPLSIASLTHIDFTDGGDHGLAWRQLLTALGAAPEPVQPEPPSREQWFLAHPYAMPPNFTGRVVERRMLTGWLNDDSEQPLLVLRALGGFGKSALTWHWLLHDVDPAEWPRVVWWSFYEINAGFESFIAEAIHYLDPSCAPSAPPREQLAFLLQALHFRGTLLILDGFERALRAFGGLNAAYQGDDTVGTDGGERDCISPLADTFLRNIASLPGMNGKVLITTRLRPTSVETREGIVLQGCHEQELVQLQPADAVEFFHAQGIRGGRAEIEAACEPYGYHPLSLRLLAGLIVGDLQQPGDIAAAQRLDVSGDLVQRQHHVLDQAYASLGPERQKLLNRIACFRGLVSYDALKAVAEAESEDRETLTVARGVGGLRSGAFSLDADLRNIIVRGLLHRDLGTNRFDLHPIVRRYAYDHLAPPDRTVAHAQLRDYFAAVPKMDKVHSLADLAPVIELYHHTVRAGQYDDAVALFEDRLSKVTFYQLGAYQLRVELLLALFPDGENHQPRLSDERAQAWTLNGLANSYSLSGQPRHSVPLFEASIEIDEKLGDEMSLTVGLGNLAAMAQIHIGALRACEANLRRRMALSSKIKYAYSEAVGRQELGRLLASCGAWAESETELATALEIFERQDNVQSQCVVLGYCALREMLRLRSTAASNDAESKVAGLKRFNDLARRALELADENARTKFPFERDYIRAHWLLGAGHCMAGDLDEAERHLNEALERCRRNNTVDHEANVLIDLARLRIATAAPGEAQRLAEEALLITERSGYVLQGADAHLVLAQLAKDRGDLKELREHATEALRLATCDGPPDYTYKAAYDEATALLR